MKRATLAFGVLMLLSLMPSPATAAPVTIVDPIIGVRGGKFGSQDITNPTTTGFIDPCPVDLAADGFACLAYAITADFSDSGIFSVLLQITDSENGTDIAFMQDFGNGDTHRPGSQFAVTDEGNGQVLLSATPPISLLSSSYSDSPTTLQCPPTEENPYEHQCGVGEDVLVYIKPIGNEGGSFTSSVLEVNGQPVPEPGTLLLMGTAAAAVAGRRLRRKSH